MYWCFDKNDAEKHATEEKHKLTEVEISDEEFNHNCVKGGFR